jgi:hypothetical protein
VDIVWENIDDRDSYHNFDKCETEICQIFDDIPYECDSIMHYHDTAFSKDGKVFITGMFCANGSEARFFRKGQKSEAEFLDEIQTKVLKVHKQKIFWLQIRILYFFMVSYA